MRSSTVFASVLAFAASTLAQTAGYAVVSAPGDGETVPAGKTYTIQWSAGKYTGPATISLLGGETDTTLEVLGSLGSVQVEKESFSWAVECSLGEDKTYGIKIADEASNGATFHAVAAAAAASAHLPLHLPAVTPLRPLAPAALW
ncbi:hypothetical protein NPX13_g6431 [Xylaria arbuscula]|uniref:Yeast cell wall synthesis Kre9/Knh1-like N-terminal domain-containing protein n=1 Tax=Xylaria arbuscula TaxID=114810 RepID=A0A9W8NC79_9PEZI|nr:hypothetical protein NPX13_g6431 [Xylaria arbuscula]